MKTLVGEDRFVSRSQLVVSVLVMLLPKLHALHVAWVRLFCQASSIWSLFFLADAAYYSHEHLPTFYFRTFHVYWLAILFFQICLLISPGW